MRKLRRRPAVIVPEPDTVKMTMFDMPLPASAEPPSQLDARATTRYTASEMRRLVDKAMTPIPRRGSPLERWMRRLCGVLVACALVVAGAILGAAWVLAR